MSDNILSVHIDLICQSFVQYDASLINLCLWTMSLVYPEAIYQLITEYNEALVIIYLRKQRSDIFCTGPLTSIRCL